MSTSKARSLAWVSLAVVWALLLAAPLSAGESGWYVAGKLGRASVEKDFGPRILGWRVHESDSSTSIEVGYGLHRYLAVQAGYHDLGSYPGQPRPCPEGEVCPLTLTTSQLVPVFPVEARFTGISVAAIPRWPVTERISVYGKLGVLDWRGKLKFDPIAQPVERPANRELLTGIGAQYAFPRGFGVLVEYESSSLVSTTSLGASWRF